MSIFEKEAEKIIDQLQEHLQQAEICQRYFLIYEL